MAATIYQISRPTARPIHPRRHRAAALILVLWAIAVLAVLAAGITFLVRQDLIIANIERDRLVSHHLARAGIERAIAEIMDDSASSDTLLDDWADYPTAFDEAELTGGTFTVIADAHDEIAGVYYGASDESARLNLNIATREQLQALPQMTDTIAAAIIDWRDNNPDPEPGGTEASHYESLPHPYNIRNGGFKTVRELLCVKGVTPELFYGEDTNANGVLDTSENDGSLTEPPDDGDGQLDRGWYAYVTIYSYEKNVDSYGYERTNLNEADSATLQSKLTLESWAADSIVKAREQKKFEHLVDLLDVTRTEEREETSEEDDADSDINYRDEEDKDKPVTKAIFQRIVDRLTLENDKRLSGRININTAPLEVLETLPGMTEEIAREVIRHRHGATGGFATIGELLDLAGVDKDTFAKMESQLTVRSQVFRIHSRGNAESGLARATIECVIDRGGKVPRVLYWLESYP